MLKLVLHRNTLAALWVSGLLAVTIYGRMQHTEVPGVPTLSGPRALAAVPATPRQSQAGLPQIADAETTETESVELIVDELSTETIDGEIESAAPNYSDVAFYDTGELTRDELTKLHAEQVEDVAANSPLPDSAWFGTELDRIAAPDYENIDILATLPEGAVLQPPKPLNMKELLAADRAQEPVDYANPALGLGTPFRIGTGNPALAGQSGSVSPDQIQIDSTEFLDYDQHHNQVYGQGRITVRSGAYKLEADRIMIDTRTREIQAYGGVLLTGPTQTVEAESLWFDAETYQGVAYNSRGNAGDFYFLADDPHCNHGTTLRQVSQSESVFKDASFTTCEFPVPHYRMKAKQLTLIQGERIFAKNVVLYVLEKPVLWLPYFTRKLNDQNPWGFSAGSDSELGFFARLFYDYHQSVYSPSDADDSIMVRAHNSKARLRLDYFSKRGIGQGLEYDYFFDHGKHRGELFAYNLRDSERMVDGEEGGNRTYVNWYHRANITEELDLLANVDYGTDPDLFYDVLDRVRSSSERERGRLPERVAQVGLEWTTDDLFAGIQVEIKDRIGRDRVSNFPEFRDNDFDYDRGFNTEDTFELAGPGFGPDGVFYPNAGRYLDPTSLDTTLDEGLATERYGRVSERLPHLRVSSNRMRLWCLPLWYHLDVNIFNNLDKGLNVVGTEDDSFVHGFDVYQSISHLAKFCDRYTLLTKVGLGVGAADRVDDSYNLDFPAGTTFPYVYDGMNIDGEPRGLTFVDEETFLVGERRMSLSQVDPFFVYGDIDSKFNARITENTNAFVRYRFREGTDNHLGTFYESMGNRKSQDDLYAFRTPEHWLEGGLSHVLPYPNVTANLTAGRNLQGRENHTPEELLSYTNLGLTFINDCKTLILNTGVGIQERQMRDPTDEFEFQQDSLTYNISGSYMPVHQRHWIRAAGYFIQNTNPDPLGGSDEDFDDRNLDTRNEMILDATVGKKIGRKYLLEVRSRIRSRADENQDTFIRLERDFHDLVAGVSLGIRSEKLSNDVEDESEQARQIRFSFRFKPSSQKGVQPTIRTSRLYSSGRDGMLDRRF